MKPNHEVPHNSQADGTTLAGDELAREPVVPQPGPRSKTGVAADARVTTTHDVFGGGNPRLVVHFHDGIDLAHLRHAEGRIGHFDLLPGVTTIGSAQDCTIRLPGVRELAAEVRRDEVDEYRFIDLTESGENRVDGRMVHDPVVLRSGSRVSVGDWTFTYERAEYADHGAPFGGHIGEAQPAVQSVPRPRGASPEGGSEPTSDEPGEYF